MIATLHHGPPQQELERPELGDRFHFYRTLQLAGKGYKRGILGAAGGVCKRSGNNRRGVGGLVLGLGIRLLLIPSTSLAYAWCVADACYKITLVVAPLYAAPLPRG